MKYLLDTNVFIEASRFYYPMDLFPFFWDWLIEENKKGLIFSIDWVYDEIKKGKDKLSEWCDKLDEKNWFLSSHYEVTQCIFSDIANWVMNHGKYTKAAKDEFLSVADPWIIAKAKADNFIVVTQEKSEPQSKKKVFIPDICNESDVKYTNTVEMLRKLQAKF